ncbi:hypothetical protein ONZ51_g2082 [Trametes cubensis]|uniref:Uncharacterized protein n=1 Tax=Trametes cubensis TaxID=1111947 RepID=A0AAD7U2K8_9APHY|nr:hypothetical protein ONZ51_g2082 [Trametes cubensis]
MPGSLTTPAAGPSLVARILNPALNTRYSELGSNVIIFRILYALNVVCRISHTAYRMLLQQVPVRAAAQARSRPQRTIPSFSSAPTLDDQASTSTPDMGQSAGPPPARQQSLWNERPKLPGCAQEENLIIAVQDERATGISDPAHRSRKGCVLRRISDELAICCTCGASVYGLWSVLASHNSHLPSESEFSAQRAAHRIPSEKTHESALGL